MKKSNKIRPIVFILILFFLILLIIILIKPSDKKTNQNNTKEFIELASLGSFNPNLINNNDLKDISFYTYAICNKSNFCQDYEITCLKNKVVNLQPIPKAIIQHSKDWIDPRENILIEDLCR